MNMTETTLQTELTENERLEKYAKASNQKILSTQADLEADNKPISEMLTWCREQGDIVALTDGTILSSNPSSRTVQNCKVVMLHKGIRPGRVMGATNSLINLLVNNANTENELTNGKVEIVSTQQQRLRILVKEALKDNASDIHIEVRADVAKIRFRRHGELYTQAEWLPNIGREIASVAFNKETDHAVTHFNPLVPQTASMPLVIDGKDIRLRLASMPAHGGFDVVLRLLTTGDDKIQSLAELGYQPEQTRIISEALAMPHGAIIISGPTGSGKTTTLASCINMIHPERKVYTIEDPVEKVVTNATQIPVNAEQFDRTFASMGRAALRMDPDVIILGEMRDLDTATVMTRAAITGHLVFSTLHTNTAPGIVTRLVDMGISQKMLGDPNLLVCLVCQRLVPTLCEKCSVPVTEAPEHKPYLNRWQQVFGSDVSKIRARGRYCHHCKGLGISGRTVVAELVWIDEAGRHFIQECDTLGWMKYLQQNNWAPYSKHALDLVTKGLVDPLDAEKVIGNLDPIFAGQHFDYNKID